MADHSFFSIKQNVEFTFTEKKSIFIAYAFKINKVDDVYLKLKELSKQHPDARHICYAYQFVDGEEDNFKTFQKASDDGEPAGTAGRPILEVIINMNLQNVLVCVVRYFGGILLGASGLIRAYSKACSGVLKLAGKIQFMEQKKCSIELPYSLLDSLVYFLNKHNIKILEISYETKVNIKILLLASKSELVENYLQELGHGNLNIKVKKIIYAPFDE